MARPYITHGPSLSTVAQAVRMGIDLDEVIVHGTAPRHLLGTTVTDARTLSMSKRRALANMGVGSLHDLIGLKASELLGIPGFGPKGVLELKATRPDIEPVAPAVTDPVSAMAVLAATLVGRRATSVAELATKVGTADVDRLTPVDEEGRADPRTVTVVAAGHEPFLAALRARLVERLDTVSGHMEPADVEPILRIAVKGLPEPTEGWALATVLAASERVDFPREGIMLLAHGTTHLEVTVGDAGDATFDGPHETAKAGRRPRHTGPASVAASGPVLVDAAAPGPDMAVIRERLGIDKAGMGLLLAGVRRELSDGPLPDVVLTARMHQLGRLPEETDGVVFVSTLLEAGEVAYVTGTGHLRHVRDEAAHATAG